jgi:predicted helicase
MRSKEIEKLASIKSFAQLVAYLRDEMGWPIAKDSFEEVDDLFFDYSADELGIDPKTAVKIEEIKRLRPLSPQQPWGIFFVKFAPKRLPVVALRRILGQVALKKRASANKSERTAWSADDLLFVSNYGSGDERQISFAHFSAPPDGDDLPTLKVLGWDDRDTALHLDAVAKELTEHLAWPRNEADADAWRSQWRSAFTVGHREAITTSRELAQELAALARRIRDRIQAALALETAKGPLTKLMTAFQQALVHDLDSDSFADMYAQTIAYGLLSARIADPSKKTADDFASHMRTSPFLRDLMETFLKAGGRRGKAGGPGIDFDELGVADVITLLDHANIEAVVRDFGDRNPQEDPVIHFYELFLKEYDAQKRMQRGVFYTPRPVVAYIVRSVHEILRTDFGLADGLADTTTWRELKQRNKTLQIPDGVSPEQEFVQILDPATGTGTFLVEVIEVIHQTLVAKWKSQGHDAQRIRALWNNYVPQHLLPRMHGYELMMAPYAIAHLKIGLKLYETGYRFASDERARIYLTNALDPANDLSGRFDFAIPALAKESQAVSKVKTTCRFTVLIGNPPYSKLSGNLSVEHRKLVDAYRVVAGERIVERGALALEMNLQDDYVKFFRLAQLAIDQSRVGVTGMITNHGFISTPTLRGLRSSLLSSFTTIRVLDLHGHSGKGETAPDGEKDQNVFDIQQGVAISFCFKQSGIPNAEFVRHADLYGTRDHKYQQLTLWRSHEDATWQSVMPSEPNFLFSSATFPGSEDYGRWMSVSQMLCLTSDGIVTARDGLVVGFTRHELLSRIKAFRDAPGRPEQVCQQFDIATKSAGFDASEVIRALRAERKLERHVIKIQYRPFDYRYLFYFKGLIQSMRWPVTSQLSLPRNILLAVTRQVNRPQYEHTFVSRYMFEKKAVSHDRNTQVFPLVTGSEDGALGLGLGPCGNWSAAFAEEWQAVTANDPREEKHAVEPLPVLYAIMHSPGYRERYFSSLRSDFPRIPIPSNPRLRMALTDLGRELVSLHTLEGDKLARLGDLYFGDDEPRVEKVSWSHNTVWLDKAQAGGFRGVGEHVWNFHIGGYQVCEKWLKDRKGRKLTKDDITHYQKIVVAISETIRLMKEIDEIIERHGGWPNAFSPSE